MEKITKFESLEEKRDRLEQISCDLEQLKDELAELIAEYEFDESKE